MATTQKTCFIASCDECKDDYENGDCITMHYDSAAEAINVALSSDWTSLPDGRLICNRCVISLKGSGEIEKDPNDEYEYRLVTTTPAN